MTVLLDLQTYRCPTMQSRLRRGIDAFNKSDEDTLLIKCIDPRFMDNLNQYLSMTPELEHIHLVDEDVIPLNENQLIEWESQGHQIVSDDIEGITDIQLALLQKMN